MFFLPSVRPLLAAILGAATVAALAADPVRGKQLYLSTNGAPLSCGTAGACHGPDPTMNSRKILNGANNPSKIQNAINNDTGGMGFLAAYLSSIDAADIAAYLGNPNGAAGVSLSTTAVAFGNQPIATNSAQRVVTISNNGAAALNLSSISVSGTHAADFVQAASSTCGNGTALAAGASCYVAITFTPQAIGTRNAAISIVSNAAGSPHSVSLSGSGTAAPAPIVSVSASSLTFGNQTVGVVSAPQTITLSNTGSAALTLGSVSLTGTHVSDFVLAGSCATGLTVAAASNCTISVSFVPSNTGARAASVSVTHNATGSPTAIALAGTGEVAAQPTAAITPTTTSANPSDFGLQKIGVKSAPVTFTLRNAGGANLQLAAIAGSNDAEFLRSGTCQAGGAVAASGGTCTIVVEFNPAAADRRTGSITVTDNAYGSAGSTQTIYFAGSGTPYSVVAAPTLEPPTQDFGVQTINTQSAAKRVVVTNTSAAESLYISALAVTGANASEFALDSAAPSACQAGVAIAPNLTCALAVTFTPTAIGARGAQIAITSQNGTGSPHLVGLTGSGSAPPEPIAILPATYSCGSAPVGATASAGVVTLANAGSAALKVNAITIMPGANAAEFALMRTAGDCSAANDLAAGASCQMHVAFTPAAVGSREAVLAISTDATGSPHSVQLTGVGTALAPAGAIAGGGNVGSGGCVLGGQGKSDLTLVVLLVAALGWLASGGWRAARLRSARARKADVH